MSSLEWLRLLPALLSSGGGNRLATFGRELVGARLPAGLASGCADGVVFAALVLNLPRGDTDDGGG